MFAVLHGHLFVPRSHNDIGYLINARYLGAGSAVCHSCRLLSGVLRSILSDMSTDEAADSVAFPDLYEAGITELQHGLDKGQFTSVDLVKVGPVSVCLRFPADISSSRHTLHGLRRLI